MKSVEKKKQNDSVKFNLYDFLQGLKKVKISSLKDGGDYHEPHV